MSKASICWQYVIENHPIWIVQRKYETHKFDFNIYKITHEIRQELLARYVVHHNCSTHNMFFCQQDINFGICKNYCIHKIFAHKLLQWRKICRQNSNTRLILVSKKKCWSLRCMWSIACRRCYNYIFILDFTPGFNRLGKDDCKTRREIFKYLDLVRFYLTVHVF